MSCHELETGITDAEQLRKIFSQLDISELIIVEKRRSSWSYENTTICIDEVSGLGFFLEIEAKGTFESIEKAKEHLYAVLDRLSAAVGPQDHEGYPYLMLRKKGLL